MSRYPLLAAVVPCLLTGAACAVDTSNVDIHGYVSQGYLNTSKNNYLGDTQGGTFDFNEAALNFQSQLTDDLRIGVQLYARDLDGIGGDQVGIDWAYADYHYRDELGFRVGEVKVARGLYNEYSDLDLANPTVLLPQSVYDERLRDFLTSCYGGSIYGNVPLHGGGSIDYEAFGGSQTIRKDGSVNAFLQSGLYNIEGSGATYQTDSASLDYMYGLSVTWNTPLRGLRLNGSFLEFNHLDASGELSVPTGLGPNAFFPVTFEISRGQNIVGGAEYLKGKLRLSGEGTIWNMDTTYSSPFFGGAVPGVVRWAGWYLQAAYQVLPRVQVAATVSEFYENRLDRSGDDQTDRRLGYQKSAALTLRFDPVSWVALKAEGAFINGYAQMFNQDNPNGYDGNTLMLSLKATVSF